LAFLWPLPDALKERFEVFRYHGTNIANYSKSAIIIPTG
jgi:hypothetical protein